MDPTPHRDHAIARGAPIVITFAALVLSRKPDALLQPQFWAEDGVVWYKQAYDMGWMSLLHPQNGYFQSISKIAGNVAQVVDLGKAPLVFAMVALFFKLLPIMLLYSRRGRDLVPSGTYRLLVGFLYIAHPYSWEVFVNVTNTHWYLALAALLVVCFGSWDGLPRKISDVAIVLLCGMSGTFALFLSPIAAWHWHKNRSVRSLVLASILALAASIQLASIVMTGATTRTTAPLDASWTELFRIVGGQITAASLLGDNWTSLFNSPFWQGSALVPFVFASAFVILTARAFRSADPLLRYLIALAAMVFVAALLQPQISGTQGQWPLFTRPNVGGRYAFIPILAFYASLAWIAATDRSVAYRRIAQLLLATSLVVGVPGSWRVRAYEDVGFAARADEFERAPSGEVIRIPVNPPGWFFSLEKR